MRNKMILSIASDLVCCDANMIQIMASSLTNAFAIFGRCPTCMKNFQKSICAMNCSPHQSKFLVAHEKIVIADEDNGKCSKKSRFNFNFNQEI